MDNAESPFLPHPEPTVPQLGDRRLAASSRGSTSALTLGSLVDETAAAIAGPHVADPTREALDIVSELLDVPRWWPAAHRADSASAETVCATREAAARRRRGMPLAYAVGRMAFRHLDLAVDERVLIPRPETEILVGCVLERARGGVAIDVGTGSGAVALALVSEGDFQLVVGTDVSLDAVAVARANARRLSPAHRARLQFRQGSYLAPVRDLRARAVVANPPYISFTEAATLPPSVRSWEPPAALFSADGGLAATAAIVRESADVLEPGGLLAIEVDVNRAERVRDLMVADLRYEQIETRLDLTGRERFIVAVRNTRS